MIKFRQEITSAMGKELLMTAIVCIEDRGGILFLRRRVSRDVEIARDSARDYEKILLTKYSLPLFDAVNLDTGVCISPLTEGNGGDVCFIEDGSVKENLDKISRLIIYKWNRTYPSDIKLGFEPSAVGFKLVFSREFVGNSHEKITKEVYER